MSKKKEQLTKRKREKARRERLGLQQTMRTGGSGNSAPSVVSANGVTLEIYYEASEMDPPLSPEGNNKASRAVELAGKQKYQKAIDLLTEVNAQEPGRASVIYNLATFRHILDQEGMKDEYNETIDLLIRDYPDYFFGKIAHAGRLIEQHRLDEAKDILQLLYRMKRLHITEFKALSMVAIDYHLAVGNEEEKAYQLHQAAVEICGEDSFPSMESFHASSLRRIFSRLAEMGRMQRV